MVFSSRLVLCYALAARLAVLSTAAPYDFVNPLIGTVNGGHVFAGATLPFGMAKAVADVTGDNQGGFASDGSAVTGFSHMHDSGTGGGASLGNFPIFPQAGCPGDDLNRCKFSKSDRAELPINGTVVARPGYFDITLNSTVRAEMTVTNHTTLYRFTFPDAPIPPYNSSEHPYPNITSISQSVPPIPVEDAAPLSPLILADLSDLSNSRINGSVSVNPTTGRMSGSGTFQPTFGIGSYVSHFCADVQGASLRDTGVFVNSRAGSEPKSISVTADGVNTSPDILPAGVYARFNEPSNNQLLVRVGVSFISVDQACGNAESEIPDFDFESTLSAAESAWKDKFSVVSIDATGVDESYQTIFWSGIYRSLISPQDYTDENPLWQSDEPYYDSFYCMWDSFRSLHPLITIIDPYSQTQMIRAIIDIYRHEGKLPDCRMSFCKGFTQGGSNADIVLVDSYLKNVSQNIDWATAYEAIVSDAEIEPENWAVEGRGGLTSWKLQGYIPTDDFDPYGVGPFTRSISRTVEYAYNDFCIAGMALELGHEADYEKYLQRAGHWQNMFNPAQTSYINGTDTGFTGFLQPRYSNGTFGIQDPIFCSPLQNFSACYLNPDGHETYEGSAWLYTFFAPADMEALITLLGGPTAFVNRLDYLHESGILYLGDEQAFLTVYQYHFAGRPGKSASRIHSYIPSHFNTTLAGIPGNDDSGAMGSFAALSMMGIFPNAGQDVYFITPPFFAEINIANRQTGNTATIRNVNFDPTYTTNIYVQSAKLNGRAYTRNWISHAFFLEGGLLELTLGPGESTSTWGTGAADVPPSISTNSAAFQASQDRWSWLPLVGSRF